MGFLKFLQQKQTLGFGYRILSPDAYCEYSIWDNKLNGLWMGYILLDKVEKYSSSHNNIPMPMDLQYSVVDIHSESQEPLKVNPSPY